MIPTMILFGLALGRWWRFALLTAAMAWPAMLIVDGTMGLRWGLLGAAGLSVLNAGVGVLIHQGVLAVVRRQRATTGSASV